MLRGKIYRDFVFTDDGDSVCRWLSLGYLGGTFFCKFVP